MLSRGMLSTLMSGLGIPHGDPSNHNVPSAPAILYELLQPYRNTCNPTCKWEENKGMAFDAFQQEELSQEGWSSPNTLARGSASSCPWVPTPVVVAWVDTESLTAHPRCKGKEVRNRERSITISPSAPTS